LSDIVACLASAAAIVALTRVWSPKTIMVGPGRSAKTAPCRGGTRLAYAPYIFIVVIFSLAQVPPIAAVLAHGSFKIQWPGLDLTQIDDAGKIAKINTTLTVNYLSVAGTLLFVSGILTMITLRVRVAAAVRIFGATLVQVRWALATIFMILAIAFVMNWSGQTSTLGRFLAGAGPAYALLSPVIGWIGVVVTGSDNSTNALFGHLQVVAAKETGISPVLLAASNTTGGFWEKCCPRRASPLAPQRSGSLAAKATFLSAYSAGRRRCSRDYACSSIFNRRLCWAGWSREPDKACNSQAAVGLAAYPRPPRWRGPPPAFR
jgi:lactate permease